MFSVQTAIKRLGYEAVVSSDPAEIRKADKVIFPGVGQASAAMLQLRASGLDGVIPGLEMPVLGVCLGMQLMFAFTEEENTPGLGIFPQKVVKFDGSHKVPHMGWNNIRDLKSELFRDTAEGERVYFVHSYYVPEGEHTIAVCDYQVPFSAAVRKDNFYGCQFHPEKSSCTGERILARFLAM